MKEVENVLRILKETRKFIEEDNPFELKALSNQTVHAAAIYQDPDNVIVAVLVYSMAKILGRSNYRSMEGWGEFHSAVIKNLDLTIKSLGKKNLDHARIYLGRIRNSLNKLEGDLRQYIGDVFRKAQINKAFKLYEHGLSSEKTAQLLGVTLWDLASYIGQSSIGDAKIAMSMPINKRVKIAEDIFR